MNADAEVMRYMRRAGDDAIIDRGEALRRSMELIERTRSGPLGFWVIEDPESGECAGWGCLKHLDKGEEIEVGYGLRRAFWGRGIATEVARCLLGHAFEDLGLERIVAVTRPENVASRNVLTKIGMTYLGLVDRYYGRETTYFELLRPDWEASLIRAGSG